MTNFATTTLRVLTPGMYERLSGREQRLADKYFLQYEASIGKTWPTDVTDDVYGAAKRAYGNANLVPLFLGNMFLMLASALITLSDGRLPFWVPAVSICVLYGFVVGFLFQRSTQISRYFISQKGARTGLVADWHNESRLLKTVVTFFGALGVLAVLALISGNAGGIARDTFGTMFLIIVPEGMVVYYVFGRRARKQDGGSSPTWFGEREGRR